MKKAQAGASEILFTGIFITAFFFVVTLLILDSIENTRYDNAYLDWKNEANLLVRRLINSKSCIAYEKKEIFYSPEEDIIKVISKTFENVIDKRKLNEQRIKDCMLYDIDSSICSDCPSSVMDANEGRCPDKYCQGDYYVRKSIEGASYNSYEEAFDALCPYSSENNCDYAGKTGTFLDLFTSPLNQIGILPCQVPSYDAVPCSSDDDGDSLYDEKIGDENKLYIKLEVLEQTNLGLKNIFSLELNKEHYNSNTYVEYQIPVKIREDDYLISDGMLVFGIAVDNVYFNSRVI